MKLSVVVSQGPVGVHLDDLDSLDEGIATLKENKSKLLEMLGLFNSETSAGAAGQGESVAGSAATEAPKTRKPRAGKDPSTASAPPPAPVPSAAPPAPAASPTVIAAAPPPPPPLAVAPPAAPAAPVPGSELGRKVVAEVKKRGAADGGAAMLEWLVGNNCGIIKGSTFEEALMVLEWEKPERLEPIAKALGVS